MFAPSAKTNLNDASQFADAPQLPARTNPDLSSSVSSISSMKVKDAAQMTTFISLVQTGIAAEAGQLSSSDTAKFPIFMKQMEVAKTGDKSAQIKAVAGMFGSLKSVATANGASQIAKAITTAAAWYWNNVEKPATGGGEAAASAKASYTPPPSAPAASSDSLSTGRSKPPAESYESDEEEEDAGGDDPFYKKTWFWVAAGVGTVALVGAIWYFWPSDAELAAAEGAKA